MHARPALVPLTRCQAARPPRFLGRPRHDALGDPRVGTGKGPAISGPGGTETAGGPKEEKAPTGRITVSEKVAEDNTSLSPDAVLGKINSAYMARIKRCYTDYLKKDASARGKVNLAFTVNATGRVVTPNAKGFVASVCATSRSISCDSGRR